MQNLLKYAREFLPEELRMGKFPDEIFIEYLWRLFMKIAICFEQPGSLADNEKELLFNLRSEQLWREPQLS